MDGVRRRFGLAIVDRLASEYVDCFADWTAADMCDVTELPRGTYIFGAPRSHS